MEINMKFCVTSFTFPSPCSLSIPKNKTVRQSLIMFIHNYERRTSIYFKHLRVRGKRQIVRNKFYNLKTLNYNFLSVINKSIMESVYWGAGSHGLPLKPHGFQTLLGMHSSNTAHTRKPLCLGWYACIFYLFPLRFSS